MNTTQLPKHTRQKLVAFARLLVQGTPLEPMAYEQQLLQQFIDGEVSIDEMSYRLDQYAAANASVD